MFYFGIKSLCNMKILFIQTGGTIDKEYPKNKNGWAFEIGKPAIIKMIQKVPFELDYRCIELMKKDSTEMKSTDLEELLQTCKECKENNIVITHGTDTILNTAKKLSVITNKTIILTGSFLPYAFKETDAEFNLGMAISGAQTLNNGIYLSLNGLIGKHEQFYRNEISGKYLIQK